MTVIVTDRGFRPDDWSAGYTPLQDHPSDEMGGGVALDLPSDTDPRQLEGKLEGVQMIRVCFPSFSDGRGFTIGRRLRLMGYEGRLRACGNLIADQYAMARRSGYDEIEISQELAERQPEDQWLRRANWKAHDYQSRLRA